MDVLGEGVIKYPNIQEEKVEPLWDNERGRGISNFLHGEWIFYGTTQQPVVTSGF